jgi:hypothetical protein
MVSHYFPPPPPFSASRFRAWKSRPHPALAHFPHGGGGLAWLEAPLPHKEIPPVLTILLCSLKLHDIWVMLLM